MSNKFQQWKLSVFRIQDQTIQIYKKKKKKKIELHKWKWQRGKTVVICDPAQTEEKPRQNW